MRAEIQYEPIEEGELNYNEDTGSLVLFRGIVRKNDNGKKIKMLHYEAEIDLAREQIKSILEETFKKFPIIDAEAYHRIGDLMPGEVSLLVSVISEHREEGFKACIYIVDRIKESVPIWKEDVYEDGTRKWH